MDRTFTEGLSKSTATFIRQRSRKETTASNKKFDQKYTKQTNHTCKYKSTPRHTHSTQTDTHTEEAVAADEGCYREKNDFPGGIPIDFKVLK